MRKLGIVLGVLLLAATASADFDVADNYRPLRYLGSEGDTSTTFDVSWPFEDEADLVVRVSTDDGLTWTTKELATDFTVTGEGADEGTVVFNDPLAADDVVMIERNDALERTEDMANLVPSRVNLEFDRQMIQYQQAEELAEKRALQTLFANDYDDACGAEVDFDVVLPLIDPSRKGRAVVVKPDGCGMTLSNGSLSNWGCIKCPGGGGDGSCDGGPDDGEDCLTNADCDGGTCDPGECDGGPNDGDPCYLDEDCPGGECKPGVCVGGSADGEPCDNDSECPDGYCDGGAGFENCDFLATDTTGELFCGDGCPDGCEGGGGGGCLDCGDVGDCAGGDNDGRPCTTDADCQGVCTDSLCVSGDACATDSDCSGECIVDPRICFGGPGDGTACTQDTDCPEDGVCRPDTNICWGGNEDGESCTSDADCTGLCGAGPACVGGPDDGEVCATNGDCTPVCLDPEREVCDGCDPQRLPRRGPGLDYTCDSGINVGDICTTNADCAGGATCTLDTCGSCGSFCTTNGDCGDACICDLSNICFGGPNDGDPCTQDTDCAEDGTCAPDDVGEVCIGGPGDGSACTQDTDCPETLDCDTADGVGVRGPAGGVNDNAVALWDGTSGAFIKQSKVRINSLGIIQYLQGLLMAPQVVLDFATESVGLFYPRTWSNPTQAQRQEAAAFYELPRRSPNTITNADSLPASTQFNLVSADPDQAARAGITPWEWGVAWYPITVFQPGVSTDSQLVARIYFTEPVICPANLVGSEVWAGTAFTGSATYDFEKNGSDVGTAIWDTDAAPNEAALSTSNADVSFVAGDYLDIDAPASADATGANLSFTLKCIRTTVDEGIAP